MSTWADRFHVNTTDRASIRSEFQRDRDRLIHSPYLRRLAGITQVAAASDHDYLHTRLTHTLEVTQLSQRLAERVQGEARKLRLDSDEIVELDTVAECAGLAHDLGHPPFGHAGEHALQKLFPEIGFEGNAQTFRILTKLALRDFKSRGLNLTRATLASVVKYPTVFDPGVFRAKYNAYASEQEEFTFCTSLHNGRSLAAQVMDLADEWAYAVADFADFIQAGLVPGKEQLLSSGDWDAVFTRLRAIRTKTGREEIGQDEAKELANLLSELRPYEDSRKWLALKARFVSNTLAKMFDAIEIDLSKVDGTEDAISNGKEVQKQLDMMEAIVMVTVIGSLEVARIQAGQCKLLEEVAGWLRADISKDQPRLIPRAWLLNATFGDTNDEIVRDYIASLTESDLLRLHRTLSTGGSGSITDRALR